MKKCETFGCVNQGIRMYQIAPATTVWLCTRCIHEMQSNDNT